MYLRWRPDGAVSDLMRAVKAFVEVVASVHDGNSHELRMLVVENQFSGRPRARAFFVVEELGAEGRRRGVEKGVVEMGQDAGRFVRGVLLASRIRSVLGEPVGRGAREPIH